MARWSSLALACAVAAAASAAAPAPPDAVPAAPDAVAAAPRPPARPRVILVPFENASRRSAARHVVMSAVEVALGFKGWDVVSGPDVERFLQAHRVRYLDSLSELHVWQLASAYRADALVLGSILAYDPDPRNPRVTVSLRIVSPDGGIAWTDVRSASASMTGGAFGRGRLRRMEDVARSVVEQLAARLPAPTPLSAVSAAPETYPWPPRVFRARDLVGQRLKICVLPLLNYSPDPDASRTVEAMLQHQLSSRPDMVTVQPADLRAAVVTARLQAPSVLSLEHLRELSKVLGTSLFLRGTILAYGGSDPSGAAAPVELYLVLIDAQSGQIMWSGLHARAGIDYEGLLRFGAIRDDATLAGQVVAELLDAFTRRPIIGEEE